jgi:hypothetical protein
MDNYNLTCEIVIAHITNLCTSSASTIKAYKVESFETLIFTIPAASAGNIGVKIRANSFPSNEAFSEDTNVHQ